MDHPVSDVVFIYCGVRTVLGRDLFAYGSDACLVAKASSVEHWLGYLVLVLRYLCGPNGQLNKLIDVLLED